MRDRALHLRLPVVSAARRPALTTAAGVFLLFALAGLLVRDGHGGASSAVLVPCPFRAATGEPCPLCGATRSVGLLAQGSGDFLRYNPVWAIALLVVFVLALASSASGRVQTALHALIRRPRIWIPLVMVLVAGSWAVALAHRSAIVG